MKIPKNFYHTLILLLFFCLLSELAFADEVALPNQSPIYLAAAKQKKRYKRSKRSKKRKKISFQKNSESKYFESLKYSWGSPYSRLIFGYMEFGYSFSNQNVFSENTGGLDLALGATYHPFGLEFKYSSYDTIWKSIGGALTNENAVYNDDFDLEESNDKQPEKPMPGAENSEELNVRTGDQLGKLTIYQIYLSFREHLFWRFNFAIKAGPAILSYNDELFQHPYEGYALAVQGALEIEIIQNLLISTSFSSIKSIVTRPPSFAKEREKWRELPINIFVGNMGLILRI